jgi:hypothetical protein
VQPASWFEQPDGVTVEREDDSKVGTDRWVAQSFDNARDVRVVVSIVVPEGAVPPLDTQQLAHLAQDPAWAFEVRAPAPPAPSPYTSLD